MPPKNLGQCVKENINVENYMGMKIIIGGMYTGEKYNDVENIMNKKCGNGIGGGRRGNYLALCSYALLRPLLASPLARFPLYHTPLRFGFRFEFLYVFVFVFVFS